MDTRIAVLIPSARGENTLLSVLNSNLVLFDKDIYCFYVFCNGWIPSEMCLTFFAENNIKYDSSDSLQEIDNSHFSCFNLSNEEYVYWLGDDDVLDLYMTHFLAKATLADVDAVLFKDTDSNSSVVVSNSFESFFTIAHNSCTFGKFCIKRKYYNNSELFFGTFHWYASFFNSMLNEKVLNVVTVFRNNPRVLRSHKKTYLSRIFSIYLVHMPQWYRYLHNCSVLNGGQDTEVIKRCYRQYILSLFNPKFLLYIIRTII